MYDEPNSEENGMDQTVTTVEGMAGREKQAIGGTDAATDMNFTNDGATAGFTTGE